MAVFIIFDVAFNFFINTQNVTWQTLHFTMSAGVYFMFIQNLKPKEIEWRFLKIVFSFYWIGVCLLYAVNLYLYSDFTAWLLNFNSYPVVVTVFTISTLSACLYSYFKLKN